MGDNSEYSGPLLQGDGEVCEPPDWAIDDLLTVEEALPLMTIESAYSVLRDDKIGSLKAGKLADLIILSDNPLEVDPDAIPDIQVLMTMVGGKVEHCESGHEALCP
jgi:predicted amidohydrolase YtcJ